MIALGPFPLSLGVPVALAICLAASTSALAGEPGGPAAAAVAGWFKTSKNIECIDGDAKPIRCSPNEDTRFGASYSPDGARALVWVSWTNEPTANWASTTAAVLRRDGDTWRVERELTAVKQRPGGVRWTASAVSFVTPVFKPSDGRCCPTGRKKFNVKL